MVGSSSSCRHELAGRVPIAREACELENAEIHWKIWQDWPKNTLWDYNSASRIWEERLEFCISSSQKKSSTWRMSEWRPGLASESFDNGLPCLLHLRRKLPSNLNSSVRLERHKMVSRVLGEQDYQGIKDRNTRLLTQVRPLFFFVILVRHRNWIARWIISVERAANTFSECSNLSKIWPHGNRARFCRWIEAFSG